jgi:hypothetical protein
MRIRWIIPQKRDQAIQTDTEAVTSADFNAPLAENDGGTCVIEAPCRTRAQAAHSEADDDIQAGRIKRFDNPDDMIASLKQPW